MKITKGRIIALYSLFLSCLMILSGCSYNNDTIKIGVVGTMSGIHSDLSVSGRRGVELAVDEFNSAGGLKGRKIELEVKDDRNDATVALRMDNEFINEKIPAVIGHYTSGMIVNSMEHLRLKDVLFLAPTVSADSLSGIDDNFIRFIATTKEQAVVLADRANKSNHKKFTIVYDLKNKGFNEALYENFKSLLEGNGGQVAATKTFTASTDIGKSDLARSVVESNAEAVLIIAGAADNAVITQQIRKIGSTMQIYSPLWSNTSDLIKKGGTAVEGMFIVGAIDIYDKNSNFVKFKESYFERYGENPTFSSVYSYEAAVALFKAMEMGPDLKPATLKKNLIKIREFKGVQGDYQIDSFGDNVRRYMVFRIENGKLRKVE